MENYLFLEHFLPDGLLNHFEVFKILELGEIQTKKMIFEIHLNENNVLPDSVESCLYESKGFLPSARIQDFPIRGKAVYLVIKRRKWRNKETGKSHINTYSHVAEGSKITEELSDFLKGTGRVPRRYDQ